MRKILSLMTLVRLAAWLAVAALVLVVWSVLDPRPIPVMLAMTLGQLIGTASLGLLVLAILLDIQWVRAHVTHTEPKADLPPAPPAV